jgi:hypothetical protein
MGSVEYVGESKNPQQRFNSHTKVKPGKAMGSFYGRQDLLLNIVKSFNTRKEAYAYQCELQSQYGLTTDREKSSQSMVGKKRKPFSLEHRQKISEANRKRKYSDETLKKMSDARKLWHSSHH